MPRLNSPAARRATESIPVRTRAGRSRSTNRHAAITFHEILRPADLGMGQLFNLIGEAAVVGNAETGRIVLWNAAAERLFGWPASEAVGHPIEKLIPAGIVRLHQASLDLFRRNGDGGFVDSHRPFELPLATAGGEEIRVELSLATLDHPSRPRHYVLALMRDVSERRRAELQSVEVAQVESALKLAERTLRRQARLVQDGIADLSRAARLLQRSTGNLTREARQAQDSPRLRLRSRIVESRAERLRHALGVLGTRAAIESGTLEPELERVNLVPLVSQVVARSRARGTPHKLNAALPQGLTVLVDARLIDQVTHALLDYTFDRSPRGCWVDVDLRRPLVGLARLEVRDFGRPVSQDLRQRLLDGTDPDRRLALVRSIVELHGGTLTFEFPADGGVRAIVTLPTQRGKVTASATA